MPIQQNGVKVKLLYKREDGAPIGQLVWGQATPTIGFCSVNGYNPIGMSCSVAGAKMTVTGTDIGMPTTDCYELTCYGNQTIPKVTTEIKLLHDDEGNIIHKRSNIVYANEDNTLISSEIKTWGVEYLNPPTPPTKPFHTFKHWESSVEGILGANTLAPKSDPVYRAKYDENYVVDRRVNGGSWSTFEWDGNYTWNGVPAFRLTWSHPGMDVTGLKNVTPVTPIEGTTVDIRSNFSFTKTIKNIYAVDQGGNDLYGPMHTTTADLMFLGNMAGVSENILFWNSISMAIGAFGADADALVFVFENIV